MLLRRLFLFLLPSSLDSDATIYGTIFCFDSLLLFAVVPPARASALELRDLMQAAYNQKTEKQAYKRLEKIRSWVSLISHSAANALTEGMRETLTVHRLGITGLLRKSLRTTNIMESAFSSVRRYMGRVTNFQDEAQRDLWVIRSLLETEKHFRGLRGHRQLRKLREQLDLLGRR